MKFSHDVIVIGGGAAGLSAASGLSQLGLKTALFEKERLGGDCLYYGCVPSKTLINQAEKYHHNKSGMPQDNNLWSQTQEVVNNVIEKLAVHDSPERFRSLGVDVYEGREIEFIDKHSVRAGEDVISAKKIILATGSRPSVPPVDGLNSVSYWTNRDVFSNNSQLMKDGLPESLIVLGGGPIGLELGQSFSRLGVKVIILEAAGQILPAFDRDLSEIICSELKKEGMVLMNSAKVISFRQENDKIICSYKYEGRVETLQAEKLLIAAGRRGNIEIPGIEKLNIKLEGNFFKTDKKLRTSLKHVFAIGDCNGNCNFTHTAGAEASAVVKQVAFHIPGSITYSLMPAAVYTKPELASAGLSENQALERGISYEILEQSFESLDRAVADGQTEGKLKILYDRRNRILGVHIVGPHASDLLIPGQIVLRDGGKIGDFLNMIPAYPGYGEVYKKAAGAFYGPKLFNRKIRSVLRFLFGYHGKKD